MFWSDRASFKCAVVLYGISAVYSIFLHRKGFRQDNRVNYLLLFGGFLLHTQAMFLRGFALDRCPVRNLFEATLFTEWTMVAIYLVVGVWHRLRFLGAFISPALLGIGLFALMPSLDVIPPDSRFHFGGGWISLHAVLFALAYGAFGLSSVAGIMYLRQERDLKQHKTRAVFSLMPPLQRLETVAGGMLLAGFMLLTLALGLSGVLAHLAKQNPGIKFAGDPKILWSMFVWGLYLALVLMRWKFAQSGRRFAYGAIGAFAFVLLTFWGTNLLSPIHHPN